jgi:hypothetical protein
MSVTKEMLEAALRAENQARCAPPADEGEIEQIAHKGATQPERPDFKPAGHVDPEIVKLAALPALDYERVRFTEAQRLRVRVSVLDHEVKAERARNSGNDSLAPPPPEPWQDPVEVGVVLDDMRAFIARFVITCAHTVIARF